VEGVALQLLSSVAIVLLLSRILDMLDLPFIICRCWPQACQIYDIMNDYLGEAAPAVQFLSLRLREIILYTR
jgi:hypothetical protein